MAENDTTTDEAEAFAAYVASSAVDPRVLFLATLAPAAVFAMVAADPSAIDDLVAALPRVAPPHVRVLAEGSDEPLAERLQRVSGNPDLAHAALQALGELQRAHPNGAALRASFLDFAREVAGEHGSTSRGKKALKLVQDVVDLPMGGAAPLQLLRAVLVAFAAAASVGAGVWWWLGGLPMRALPLLLLLAACRAPNDTAGADDTDPATDNGSGSGSDPATEPATDIETWWTDPAGDADGDGWTADEGDCDDTDERVNPSFTTDTCDGLDNDCDGALDEDFGYVDPSASLGDLTSAPETLTYAWLFPEGDEDVWTFYAEDLALSWFDLEIALYDVPLHSDWALDLYRVDDASGSNPVLVDSADDQGAGGNELINYGGSDLSDNSSWYQVVVRGVGAQCSSPYTLQILVGTW